MTQEQAIVAIREMSLTCVRVSDVKFRLGYPLGDPRRIFGNKDADSCADNLAAAYDKALGWHYRDPSSYAPRSSVRLPPPMLDRPLGPRVLASLQPPIPSAARRGPASRPISSGTQTVSFVYRHPLLRPLPRQPLPEDALWARLAENRADEHGADLVREIALVQLRRGRLQSGIANRKRETDDRH